MTKAQIYAFEYRSGYDPSADDAEVCATDEPDTYLLIFDDGSQAEVNHTKNRVIS